MIYKLGFGGRVDEGEGRKESFGGRVEDDECEQGGESHL